MTPLPSTYLPWVGHTGSILGVKRVMELQDQNSENAIHDYMGIRAGSENHWCAANNVHQREYHFSAKQMVFQ